MSQDRVDNLFASESWTAVYTAFTNVSLKAYDFDTIREALLAYTKQTYPEKFNDFIASSEFIAILDLVAYLGHSLSFRLDMNTRENFLDLAERRASILQMAKTLGYNKTRPINAKGFMKITSISTNEDVYDNEGNSLAGSVINWNDANNVDWYEDFISIINSSFAGTTKIQNPNASLTVANVEHYSYEINEDVNTKAVTYTFNANIDGGSRTFDTVRTEFINNKVVEAEPNPNKNFTIINRNDNLGPASDRTGFFVFAKAGTLAYKDFQYNTKISNRVEPMDINNVSNSDVWVQKINNLGEYSSSVTKVDNDTRETAIFNSLRNGNGDIVNVTTLDNNAISLHYPDGVFGNAAFGNYRVWYRQADNENFSVNAEDVIEKLITIPYVGADGRTYRLSLTVSSTKDFGENYAGETYASVRRVAPRSYYAQDRMVNAQDYNVYPLTLGNNVVRKTKAVNTTFAGSSRFFEMDDTTGHHSNLSVTGTDGSIFVENETTKMSLSFNKLSGDADNFIRNVLVKAIKHPSLVNKYYHTNKDAATVTITNVDVVYTVGTTNSMQINSPLLTDTLYDGDYLQLLTASGEDIWTKVTDSSTPYTLNEYIPEDGTIKTIVRGFRTKFTESEITEIKTQVNNGVSTFTLYYTFEAGLWGWSLDGGESDIQITFTYTSGLRDMESEYVATIPGKKIAFESRDQVKFYYSNSDMVIDNETSLAERDLILINYKGADGVSSTQPSTTVEGDVTIGYTTISNYVDDGSGGATFDAEFKHTGADVNYTFYELDGNTDNPAVSNTNVTSCLVTPEGIEYPIDTTTEVVYPVDPTWRDIGESPEYKISLEVDDITQYISSLTSITDDVQAMSTTEYALSDGTQILINTDGDWANANSSYTTMSDTDLVSRGFKGEVSTTYFSQQQNDKNFAFLDSDELPGGNNASGRQSAAIGDPGVQWEYVVSVVGNQYTFTLPALDIRIDSLDLDIYFKQWAYAELDLVSSTALTTDNLILKNSSTQAIISTVHTTVTHLSGNNYKVIFWTIDPGVGTLIDAYIGDASGTTSLVGFGVKVKASFDLSVMNSTQTTTYDTDASYVYDKYLTPEGYVDNTKVKLLTFNVNNYPYAMLDIAENNHMVLEQYSENNITYERASRVAFATPGSGPLPDVSLPPTATLWYNTTNTEWYIRLGDGWLLLTQKTINADGSMTTSGITYRVVEGISFAKDVFMSFRWDHYADTDKRIDPSTSNIVDVYVLSSDYVRNVNNWISSNFTRALPVAPNSYELSQTMSSIESKASISDHISYIPVQFKYLFGAYAEPENQAVFKVIKKLGSGYTDSETKAMVSSKVNEYFSIDNWDFGATFYFSELAAYLHKELGDYISSVVITPKYSGNTFTKLLSISSELNEIFMSVTTSSDVSIIKQLSQSELQGE